MKERYETFTVLITKINRNIRKLKNREMAEYDLRSSHISCLYYLYSANALTATELCEKCDEDKATISRTIEYLEQNGYLTCEARQIKRYKSPLILTEKGKEVGQKIYDKVRRVLDTVSLELTEEERILFYKNLTMISDCLDKAANEQ